LEIIELSRPGTFAPRSQSNVDFIAYFVLVFFADTVDIRKSKKYTKYI